MGIIGKSNTISIEQLQAKISKLKSYPGARGMTYNPIPFAPVTLRQDIAKVIGGADIYYLANKESKLESVPIQALTTLQNYTDRNHLKNLSNVRQDLGNERLIVYKYNGNYVVADGNHRLALEYMKGTKNKKVPVIDVNEFENKYRR